MLKNRVFIVLLIVILLVLCSTVYLAACGGSPVDPMYATIDDNVFAPQVYFDSEHDVVCYKYSGQMDCVYVGAR